MVALNFNAHAVEPNTGFDPLPAGWYNVKITDSDLKPTRDGTGKYIALTFEVLDGQYANRKVFTNLNIENKNPVAVNIAYADLSAICRVCGIVDLQDTAQLHGIPLQVKLSVTPATEQYDAGNNVKGYRDQYGRDPKELAGAAAAPAAPGAPAAPAAPTQPIPANDVQTHTDAAGNVYHLINNEWVLQAPQPAAPPPPPATPAPPAPPAAPAAPPAPPAAPAAPPAPPAPPATPAAPAAAGGAVTPPWGPPKA